MGHEKHNYFKRLSPKQQTMAKIFLYCFFPRTYEEIAKHIGYGLRQTKALVFEMEREQLLTAERKPGSATLISRQSLTKQELDQDR